MATDAHPDGLRCPTCRSTNVVCHGRPHGHECQDCGYDGTTPDLLTQALALLRSHADVCSRYGESDQLRSEADRIEALASTVFDRLPGEPVPDDAGVAAGPQATPQVTQERVAFALADALGDVVEYDAANIDAWSRRPEADEYMRQAAAVFALFERAVAGVAAGPQATPGQVLWEGETCDPSFFQELADVDTSEITQEMPCPPGTRVRVVAVPTDHEDQPSDAERADPDRDRPDTTVTPQAQPHSFAGSDDSPDGPR